MPKNIIILTGGLAGSSVLTSLLNRAEYWVGADTMKKKDYNTWENSELVRLNRKILDETGFKENWTMVFRPDYLDSIAKGFEKIDPEPFRAFMNECNNHQPWIWKDPRLWLTIRYWRKFIDPENVFFLTIRRDPLQSWISTTIRRQIQTRAHSKRYGDGVDGTISDFLHQENLPYLNILYEDLLMKPEEIIKSINQGAGTNLSFEDFRSVFRGKLYRKQHGLYNLALAYAIYLKNYRERYF